MSKTQKLVEKYPTKEINICLMRLLGVSEDIIRNQEYSLNELSARVSLDRGIVEDVLEALVDIGIFVRVRDKTYAVPDF